MCVVGRVAESEGGDREGETEATERQDGGRLAARVAESAAQLGKHVSITPLCVVCECV